MVDGDCCLFHSVIVFVDQEMCSRNIDYVAIQAKIHRFAKVYKQCRVIINVKDATGCKVMTRSMTIMDSISYGVRSYL